jgi:hypothetical protein
VKVFVLEDDGQRIALFQQAAIGHDLTLVEDVDAAIKKWEPPYDVVCLDHDLGQEVFVNSRERNTGAGFCRWLVQHGAPHFVGAVIVHSYNRGGALEMVRTLEDAGWERVVWHPFGPTVLKVISESKEAA